MQPKPLREIDARGRSGAVEGHPCGPVVDETGYEPNAWSVENKAMVPQRAPLYDKTLARLHASSEGRCCEACLRARNYKPSYILDLVLGCRCQAVGNWVAPGGVMSVAHPPASWRQCTFSDGSRAPSRGKLQAASIRRRRNFLMLESDGIGVYFFGTLLRRVPTARNCASYGGIP